MTLFPQQHARDPFGGGDVATLMTPRLTLRPLRSGDAAAIVAGVGNYDVSRWLSVVPFPYSDADATAFLASPAAEPRISWAICDGAGLRGIVSIGIEFGYWLSRNAWGRGYATEAGAAVIDAAFADPTRRAISASYMIGNDRSAGVLCKLGFREISREERMFRALNQTAPTAVLRMTRAEWRRSRGLSLRRWWSIARPAPQSETLR